MLDLDEKYGEGGFWYLNPKVYCRPMYKKPKEEKESYGTGMADLERTAVEQIDSLIGTKEVDPEGFREGLNALSDIMRDTAPGQVIPLEDAKKIMHIAQPLVKIDCICRRMTRARLEEGGSRSCMGVGLGMLRWEINPERYKGGVEFISPEEGEKFLEFWDRKGMVHTVMTFGKTKEGAPYIGGVCNCDYPDCIAIRLRNDYGIKSLLKGEYVAKVDYDRCSGCGTCVERCQFGAIKREVTTGKTNIDMFRCFGCGLCKETCPESAISLLDRNSLPPLREEW
jgi:ferredoxin